MFRLDKHTALVYLITLRKLKRLISSNIGHMEQFQLGMYDPRNVDDITYWFITTVAREGILSKFMISNDEYLVQFAYVKDVV